jgi:uncharacterized protein (DUF2062 family)
MWLEPLRNQLTQGVTPRALALSLAVGFGLGLFPVPGATAILCAVTAALLRLNHPTVQLVNLIAYPLQLLLFVPLLRAGAALFGAPDEALALDAVLLRIGTDPWGAARLYGQATAGAVLVWAAVAAPSMYLLARALRPLMARLPILPRREPEPVRGRP